MGTVRNDLALAPYSDPAMVFTKVAPALVRYEEAGKAWYQPYNADVSAQTGRSPLGAVTANAIAAANKNFACEEILSRQEMSYDQVIQGYRDILSAEFALARLGKRAVGDTLELQLATALLASPEDLSSSTNLPGDVEALASALADKAPGRVALVLSAALFGALKADSEIKDRMKNIGIAIGEGGDPRKITEAQMAAVMGVDEVIVGPGRVWNTPGAKTGALVILPTEGLAPNEEPQYGRIYSYEWNVDGEFLPFLCESFYNDLNRGYNVDTVAKAQFLELNAALKQAVTLLA